LTKRRKEIKKAKKEGKEGKKKNASMMRIQA